MNKTIFLWIVPITIIFLASLFASSSPDALEAISEKYGFADNAQSLSAFFADYSFPFIDNPFLTTLIAGISGLLLIYLLYKLITTTFRKVKR